MGKKLPFVDDGDDADGNKMGGPLFNLEWPQKIVVLHINHLGESMESEGNAAAAQVRTTKIHAAFFSIIPKQRYC